MSTQIIVRVPDSHVRPELRTEEVWVYDYFVEEDVQEERSIRDLYVEGVSVPAICAVGIGDGWMELMFSANYWSDAWTENKEALLKYPHRFC